MKKLIFWTLILSITVLLLNLSPKNAEAVPAFARKYKTACMTCHATYPRQTALGEAFRLNGYKMPEGDEIYVKDPPVSMGAEAYKRVWPKAVWPSDIPGLPPISLRVIGDLEVDIGDTGDSKDNRTKIEFPHELEILSGGSFGDNMSFWVELEFEEPADPEIAFSAWLMWEDIIWRNYFNIKAGSIGMNEIDPPNTRDHARITKSHYLFHERITKGLGDPGVEANGFGKNWRYAAGWVKPQDGFADGSYYLQAALKFGGLGFDGTGGTTEEGLLETTPAGYWRDDAIFFGGFVFKGDDNINRYGVDARWNFKDLVLAVGYVKEDNDIAPNSDENVVFVEAEYFFFPWMQSYARYERLDADPVNSDLARLVIGAALLARANVKVNLEGMFFTDNEPREILGLDKDVDNRVFLRLDYAF